MRGATTQMCLEVPKVRSVLSDRCRRKLTSMGLQYARKQLRKQIVAHVYMYTSAVLYFL